MEFNDPNNQSGLAETTELNIGFMRSTDSAPLIIAKAENFFERYGLKVNLCRETSWASIRDKVVSGNLDAAQMLAPMPLICTPGIKNKRSPFITGLLLSLNGNAITLSSTISKALNLKSCYIIKDRPDPVLAAHSLAKLIKNHPRQLTFATVYPYSMQTFELRDWLESGGIKPDHDVKIIVLPPEQMVNNLARGNIDGFCVDEPWNTLAVQSGIGQIMTTGHQIWNNAPEKALVVTEQWHQLNPDIHLRIRLAVMEAAVWLSHPENRLQAIKLIASKTYLDLPEHVIKPALLGNIQYSQQNEAISNPDFLVFQHYHAGFPWHSSAEYILRRNYALQKEHYDCTTICHLRQRIYRTDLYREAAIRLGYNAPQRDFKPEGTHDAPYTFEQGIELGPDQFINGKKYSPCQHKTT